MLLLEKMSIRKSKAGLIPVRLELIRAKSGLIWAKLLQERLSQQRFAIDFGIRQIQIIVQTTTCSASLVKVVFLTYPLPFSLIKTGESKINDVKSFLVLIMTNQWVEQFYQYCY